MSSVDVLFHASKGSRGQWPARGPSVQEMGYWIVATIFAFALLFSATLQGFELWSDERQAHLNLYSALRLCLACTEWLIALATLANTSSPRVRRLLMWLILAFIVYLAIKLLIGSKDCGCFGMVHINPKLTITFDLLTLMGLYFLGRASNYDSAALTRGPRAVPKWLNAAIVSTTLPLLMVHFISSRSARPWAAAVFLDRGFEPGQHLNIVDYVEPSQRAGLNDRSLRLLIVRGSCESCRRYLQSQARSATGLKGMTVIDLDQTEDAPTIASPTITRVALDSKYSYYSQVPVYLEASNGIITTVVHPTE